MFVETLFFGYSYFHDVVLRQLRIASLYNICSIAAHHNFSMAVITILETYFILNHSLSRECSP